MKTVLALNPGSASLKFDVVELEPGVRFASQGRKRLSAAIEKIGDDAALSVFSGRQVTHTEPCGVGSMAEGARFALEWISSQGIRPEQLTLAGLRVVHGGDAYAGPAQWSPDVQADVERWEALAPLHNRSSLEIAAALRGKLQAPLYATFDTAFHRSLPQVAWRYPVERETADRHQVRKYGFHGLSHRYMRDEYARLSGRPPHQVSAVTLHLESGSSAAAILNGKSIDTTMGMTPLEGLMMGSRCGSVDPAIVPYLMERMGVDVHRVMHLLNRESGLLGIAGGTLDTRELVKRGDEPASLALRMFAYRVKLAVGAYLAVLGGAARAVLFGGGIGENTPSVRADVCHGLAAFGLQLDEAENEAATSGTHRISAKSSMLEAWTVAVEEGLQIAHDCLAAHTSSQ